MYRYLQKYCPHPLICPLFDRLLDCFKYCFNSLPNDKILDWFNFKAFADDKINVASIVKFVLGGVENIVVKGENAGYHNVFFSPMFSKGVFLKVVKSWDCVVKS